MLSVNNASSSFLDIPVGELVEQNKDQVDVNFIARNNFNNNPYRNNYENNYSRPYPQPNNKYGSNNMPTCLEGMIK